MQSSKIIYSYNTLVNIVRDAKAEGKRIGLTHGAFDLFHYAHLDLLKKSSKICDFLIVGVDSDASIASYKPNRPITKEWQRLKIIGELNCVDAVFVKDIGAEVESHIELYKDLLADIITIGTRFETKYKTLIDYESEQSGATLIEIETYQDISTTGIINQIVDKFGK